MKITFKGGVVLPDLKRTVGKKTVIMPNPATVTVSLMQHDRMMAMPLVQKGSKVRIGSAIATDTSCGVNIHSPISGTVREISDCKTSFGESRCIIIDNDYRDEKDAIYSPFGKKLSEATKEEITDFIRSKGIVGLGGAFFPTHKKIETAAGKADTLIINCLESEPNITATERLIIEKADGVIEGAKVILAAVGAKKAVFAVDSRMNKAAEAIKEKLKQESSFSVRILKNKYPQGDERHLVYVIAGKDIPFNKYPYDVGCVVFNAETCNAVNEAFYLGKPLISKLVTVSGKAVGEELNLSVPIGTSFEDVINFCGGYRKTPEILLDGGVMMGKKVPSALVPVLRSTNGITLFDTEKRIRSACIRCGRCANACPMKLFPHYIYEYCEKGFFDEAVKSGMESCSECGICNFVCPSKIDIVETIKKGKQTAKAALDLK